MKSGHGTSTSQAFNSSATTRVGKLIIFKHSKAISESSGHTLKNTYNVHSNLFRRFVVIVAVLPLPQTMREWHIPLT